MFKETADEDLMVMYQKGEVRAFEVLLSRHRKPVYNFILRFVGDKETAEDLLQEAFMRVIKGAEAYKRQAKFTTWLYTIARNLCVDQTRRRKHRKHASLDAPMDSSEESGTLMDVIPGNEMASDRKSVNKQLHETMQQAIASLSEEQREMCRVQRKFLNRAAAWPIANSRQFSIEPQLRSAVDSTLPQLTFHYIVTIDAGDVHICRDIDDVMLWFELG